MASTTSWGESNDLYINQDRIINTVINKSNCQKPIVFRNEGTYTSTYPVFGGEGTWDIDSYVVGVDKPCCAIVAIGYEFYTSISSPEDLVLSDNSYGAGKPYPQLIQTHKYNTGTDNNWRVQGFVIRIIELNKSIDSAPNFHLRLGYKRSGHGDLAFSSFEHTETFLIISEQTVIDFKTASINWFDGKLVYNGTNNKDETFAGNFDALIDGKTDLTKIVHTYRTNAPTKQLPYTFDFSSYIDDMNTIMIIGYLLVQSVEGDKSPKEQEMLFNMNCNGISVPLYTRKHGSTDAGDIFENDFCMITKDFKKPILTMDASYQMQKGVDRGFYEVFDIIRFKDIDLPQAQTYDTIKWVNADLILSNASGETSSIESNINEVKSMPYIESHGGGQFGEDYVLEIDGKKGDIVFVEASFRQDLLFHQTNPPEVSYTEPLHRSLIRSFKLLYHKDDGRDYYSFNNYFRFEGDGKGQITFKMTTASSGDVFSGKVRTLHLHALE